MLFCIAWLLKVIWVTVTFLSDQLVCSWADIPNEVAGEFISKDDSTFCERLFCVSDRDLFPWWVLASRSEWLSAGWHLMFPKSRNNQTGKNCFVHYGFPLQWGNPNNLQILLAYFGKAAYTVQWKKTFSVVFMQRSCFTLDSIALPVMDVCWFYSFLPPSTSSWPSTPWITLLQKDIFPHLT